MDKSLTMLPKRLMKYVAYDDKNQPYVKYYSHFYKKVLTICFKNRKPRDMANYLKMLDRNNQLVKI